MAKRKTKNRPQRLKKGDAVGIVAPASHYDQDMFHEGIAVLESMGFRPVFNEHLYEIHGNFAGSDDLRAGQINRFFADPSIKGLVCARGGFGCIRILHLIDLPLIRNNPKCFVGFSDITALLSLMFQQCGLSAFHGPTVTTLSKATHKTREAFYTALTSDRSITIKTPKGRALNSGSAKGRVIGGNLATFCHLLATPFQPDLTDRILLLEDVGETPYKIDRMLTQMKLAGCFGGLGLLNGDSCLRATIGIFDVRSHLLFVAV